MRYIFMLLLTEMGRSRRQRLEKMHLLLSFILFLSFFLPSGGAVEYISGGSYTFSAPVAPEGESYSYAWTATDGSPLTSTDSTFSWTAPLVTESTNVVIDLLVSSGAEGCSSESQLEIQVLPKGEITLAKSLDPSIKPDEIKLGDTIAYTITITNTGGTSLTTLPLADVYPDEFLKAMDSNPSWSKDEALTEKWDTMTLRQLVWDNLLTVPLPPGSSVTVTARFQVIRIQGQIMNLARVDGAKDDTGATLDPKEADFIIAPAQYQCPPLGPTDVCTSVKAVFSTDLNLPSYEWTATDDQGDPVGGFDDPTKASVTWTAPAAGQFTISFNNMLCSQMVTAKDCKPGMGEITLAKSLDPSINPDQIKLGDTIAYTITITNTGGTSLTALPLADVYPNEFLKAVDSNPSWSKDEALTEKWDTMTLRQLVWDNLITEPLAPGSSVTVTARFQVIRIQDQIMNLARVDGAKDDTGSTLDPVEADFIIAPAQYTCPSLGPTAVCAGVKAAFSTDLNLPAYEWTATDEQGNTVGGFDDPTKASVTWTTPAAGRFTISFNNMLCSQTVTATECESGISIKKSCDFTAPVHVGDTVTYIYEVTNAGGLPLGGVSVSDIQDWGPACQPTFISGDNGNGLLDPGESWRYECRYVVPDPADYPTLQILADSASQMQDLISRLTGIRTRLEIEMGNLRQMQEQFDFKAARMDTAKKTIQGVVYTFRNYTNEVTGEGFSEMLGPDQFLNKTTYLDPTSGAVFTTRYGPGRKIFSEELYFPPPGTKDYIKIEYDQPYQGYRNVTITDYQTGDTLIFVIDGQGNILSKEYRKTPGYRPYEEKFFLKNTATVMGKSPDGKKVSSTDTFTLEIFKPAPLLAITKEAEPSPVVPGAVLNYTITYENGGAQDAHEVMIKETYDKTLTFLWADPAPDFGTIDTWTIGDLKKGESGKIKIRVRVSASAVPGSQITNRVAISSKEKSSAQVQINTAVAGVGLVITKTASASIITPGAPLIYTITYSNEAAVKQTNVVVHDYLDEGIADWDASKDFQNSVPPKPFHFDPGNKRHLLWNVGDLDPGASGTIEIHVRAKGKEYFKENANTIINTYKINSTQIEGKELTLKTFVVQSLWIKKTADKGAYYRDENITYTINYGNAAAFPANNVNITDILPEVEFISASPEPTKIDKNILTWYFKELGPGANGTILLVVHIPEKPKLAFDEASSVKGEGYVYVRKSLSTEEEKPTLTNTASITGKYDTTDSPPATSSSTVTILGAAGTKILTKEHGSGHYEEEEKTSLRLENKSIGLQKDIFAKHRKSSFSLPGKRNINYESLWSDLTTTENRVLNDKISEKYMYVDTLHKNSTFRLDMNQTVYKSETDFTSGMAEIDYRKHTQNSTQIIQEISEGYHGSFKVLQSVDSYGDNVKYSKSSTGKGFVSSDKRSPGPQRSYEHGSGYYSANETSQLSSVLKDVKMLYAPVKETAGQRNVSYTALWKEGMSTIDPENLIIITEEIRLAPYIKKEAEMGKSFLSFLSSFNGTMDLEAIRVPNLNNRNHLEQRFVGSYQMSTAISFYAAPKYLYPHVTIEKKAAMVDENTVLFQINVTNDGNELLRHLNVTDRMPAGLVFINSSLRPKVNGQFLNWTVSTLEISRTLTIKLHARVKGDHQIYTNIVSVTTAAKDLRLEARNSTRFEAYYSPLPCCPGQELLRVGNVTPIRPYWGTWKPSPCFNVTTGDIDCAKEIEDYYDELERNLTSCCASNYEIP